MKDCQSLACALHVLEEPEARTPKGAVGHGRAERDCTASGQTP